jgi:uncharacterized membrane protein (UPF0127 family)
MQIGAPLVALLALAVTCARGGPVATIRGAGAVTEVALEVASTPEAQERGLMYRTSLADGHGMLFVFESETEHQFWMKNTLIPLDMIFIAADGRITGIHPDATPLSTAPITVGQSSRFVLEVPGGFCARRGIVPGDRVEFRGVPSP